MGLNSKRKSFVKQIIQSKNKMSKVAIKLMDVTSRNINQLKELNAIIFPVSYNDRFYVDIWKSGGFAKLACYNGTAVGAICCHIDTSGGRRRLYISTLGCLHSYRRLGIGSAMIQQIFQYAEDDGHFDSISLHVQINNDNAIQFYRKFGFEIVETIDKYYSQIQPVGAFVLEKRIQTF